MSEQLVEAGMAFVLALGPAEHREYLRRQEEAFQVELISDAGRLRRLAAAMHEAYRIVGGSPSVRQYKKLRREHPERGWPDPRSVMRWLGVSGWNAALVRLGLEPVLDGDYIEGALGPTYSIEEVITAIRDCTADLGHPPTHSEYLWWQRQAEVRDRPGRRPASTWVFNRIFGGFAPARIAAGVVDGEPPTAHPSDLLLRSENLRIRDEQIVEDIRFVASRTSGPLTSTVYDQDRRLVYLETRAAGRPRALAAVGTIYRRHRTWKAALQAAGVDEARSEPRGNRHGRRLTDEQLLHALRSACEAVPGHRLTQAGYEAWRKGELADNPERAWVFPSYSTIWRRFGNLRAALLFMRESPATPAAVRDALGDSAAEKVARMRSGSRYSDAQFLQALRSAVEASGQRLSGALYEGWRDRQLEFDPALDSVLPSFSTILRRFGSLGAALAFMEKASCEPLSADIAVPPRRRHKRSHERHPYRFSDDRLLHALSCAYDAADGRLTQAGYQAWRDRELRQLPERSWVLPSYSTIFVRFGSFQSALKRTHEWRSRQ